MSRKPIEVMNVLLMKVTIKARFDLLGRSWQGAAGSPLSLIRPVPKPWMPPWRNQSIYELMAPWRNWKQYDRD